jgi:plastocyanin
MRRLVLLIITLAATAACNGSSYSGSNAPSATPIPAGANTVLVPSGSYNGPGPGYAPSTLTVPVGTTVQWGNNDITAHTSTADGGQWNSNNIAPGQSFTFKFNTAGTYKYHCTIHSFMTGTIVVQ